MGGGLNRYAALVLLVVPWLVLEPIKPVAFLLFARKHHLAATLLIVVGEVVKLTLFEQLFDMAKPKLMSFGWFAWGYGRPGFAVVRQTRGISLISQRLAAGRFWACA